MGIVRHIYFYHILSFIRGFIQLSIWCPLGSNLCEPVGVHTVTTEGCASLAGVCVVWGSRSSLGLYALWVVASCHILYSLYSIYIYICLCVCECVCILAKRVEASHIYPGLSCQFDAQLTSDVEKGLSYKLIHIRADYFWWQCSVPLHETLSFLTKYTSRVPSRNARRPASTMMLSLRWIETLSTQNLCRSQLIIHEVCVLDLNRTNFSMATRESTLGNFG